MVFFVYIIFSASKTRYSVGHTDNLQRRFVGRNSGLNISTKFGVPWELVFQKDFPSRSEAMIFENMIKKRGIKRFLDSLKK
jgi:putative endonuclease